MHQAGAAWQHDRLLLVFGLFTGFVDNETKRNFQVLSLK